MRRPTDTWPRYMKSKNWVNRPRTITVKRRLYEDAGYVLDAAVTLDILARRCENQDEALLCHSRAVEKFVEASKDPRVADAFLEIEVSELGMTVSPVEIGNLCYLGVAYALCAIGNIHQQNERYELALEHYSQTSEAFAKVRDKSRCAKTLQHMAEIYEKQGLREEARTHYVQSATVYEKAGSDTHVAISLNLTARNSDDPQDAL
ncbi:hypothetical protein BDD12DRAFT_840211 [Trichophaea hybrida]|nr:hypothetical protein BDD12DRAFT_840211 [Trichophaea hybrida]